MHHSWKLGSGQACPKTTLLHSRGICGQGALPSSERMKCFYSDVSFQFSQVFHLIPPCLSAEPIVATPALLQGLEKHNLSFCFPLNGHWKNPYKICVCCYHTLGNLRQICNVRKQMGVSGWKGSGSSRALLGKLLACLILVTRWVNRHTILHLSPFSFFLSLQNKLLERSP